MNLSLKKHRIQIDLSSFSIAFLILAWSTYYYVATLTGTEEGPETVLFIKPVFFGILVCFPFVLWSSISIKSEGRSFVKEEPKKGAKDRGFFEKRRLLFTAASVGYCLALPFLGYIVPSALYVLICCYFFGTRNLWVLLALPIGLSSLLAVVFKILLSVPIPIWPVW